MNLAAVSWHANLRLRWARTIDDTAISEYILIIKLVVRKATGTNKSETLRIEFKTALKESEVGLSTI